MIKKVPQTDISDNKQTLKISKMEELFNTKAQYYFKVPIIHFKVIHHKYQV